MKKATLYSIEDTDGALSRINRNHNNAFLYWRRLRRHCDALLLYIRGVVASHPLAANLCPCLLVQYVQNLVDCGYRLPARGCFTTQQIAERQMAHKTRQGNLIRPDQN